MLIEVDVASLLLIFDLKTRFDPEIKCESSCTLPSMTGGAEVKTMMPSVEAGSPMSGRF